MMSDDELLQHTFGEIMDRRYQRDHENVTSIAEARIKAEGGEPVSPQKPVNVLILLGVSITVIFGALIAIPWFFIAGIIEGLKTVGSLIKYLFQIWFKR